MEEKSYAFILVFSLLQSSSLAANSFKNLIPPPNTKLVHHSLEMKLCKCKVIEMHKNIDIKMGKGSPLFMT